MSLSGPRETVSSATEAGRQTPSNLYKEFISRSVTEAVVIYLEFVDVDEQYREPKIPVALRNSDRPLQTIEKERPVGKVGQPIVESAMLQ